MIEFWSDIMKKTVSLIVCVLLVIGLCACSGKSIKEDIFNIVEENVDILIEAINTGDYGYVSEIKGITDITVNDDYIVFYCRGQGIAPSSQEYGFYYSIENQPVAIFDGKPVCKPENMTVKDGGYEYIDSSHNLFYTENIVNHFYYYDNNL